MTEITVRAADSSLAMEEIQKLGNDAYIVSTRKTGGQIEIVATDDNAAFTKKEKPFVLEGDYRINSFSSILDGRIAAASESQANSSSNEMHAYKKIDQVISELVELKQLYNENQKSTLDEDPYIKLRLMGFSKQVVESLKEKAGEEKIDSLIKRISKLFVSGKNKYFDESDVFIIVGQKVLGNRSLHRNFALCCEMTLKIVKSHRLMIKILKSYSKRLKILLTNLHKH